MGLRVLGAAAAVIAGVLASGCRSGEPTSLLLSEEELATEPTLRIGDAAPALVVREWLRSGPVDRFEAGKVYVIDFWASWCGPCLAVMPELAELQARYKDAGVVVVAMTALDGMNTRGDASEAMRLHGGKGNPVAFAIDGGPEGNATVQSYMHAARESGIPRTFIVDQQGRLAWIGHPEKAGRVVGALLGGTWDLSAARDARDRAARERTESRPLVRAWIEACERKDDAATLELLNRLTAMSPENVAHSPSFWFQKDKISLLRRLGDNAGARAAFDEGISNEVFAREGLALAEFARALGPADTEAADRAAVRAEELVKERAASAPAGEWERYLKDAYASWDAQALQVLGEYWYGRGNPKEAARLMRASLALNDEFPQVVEARKKLLASYEAAAR
jgi:thiol-disulfide isomerase/thioredoxin